MGWRRTYYKHDLYEIRCFEEVTGYTHLAIGRRDGKPITSTWDVLFAIKNDICGHHRYAVEVFPEIESLVFEQNMRHLWVFPEGERLDFGPHW